MVKGLKRFFKKTKLKVFLLFLFIAMFFWFLTKFSREYTVTIEAQLTYVNFPKNTVPAAENPQSLVFDSNLNGFEFLYYQLKKPVIPIDVKKFYVQEREVALISQQELLRLITAHLKLKTDIKNLSPQSIELDLDGYVTKRVPVRAEKDITFQQGFRAIDSLLIEPDSVEVSGPSLALEQIHAVNTQKWVLENINGTTSEKVTLQRPEVDEVALSEEKVSLTLRVDEFTQKSSAVPIELLGVPAHLKIKLIPETITLIYNVSIHHFQDVSASDFKVVCRYEDRNEEGSFMVPQLTAAPKTVQDIEMDTRKIDYLIFK
ncbi:MAG: hypothetical protein CMC08_01870 [Flavobacteriaceae bacterium]|nr:hypothetical protein [Flavobacteriaceae bacterium]